MIRSNLFVLLAERNLKISRVAADTGISRTTLTALSSNGFQGIQMDTLDTLCLYLNVRPEDILHYVPLSAAVKCFTVESENYAVIDFEATIDGKKHSFNIPWFFEINERRDDEGGLELFSCEFFAELWPESEYNELPIKLLKRLPVPFLKDIESAITRCVWLDMAHELHEDDVICTYHWDALLNG